MKRIIWGKILLLMLLLSVGTSMAATPVALPQSVTVTANSSINITLQGQEGTAPITYAILAIPSHGILTPPQQSPLSGNTVTYTPTSGFTGTDSFTFWVMDSEQNYSSAATVTITVTDDDFLLTFVTATLIPIIKQKQDEELQNDINNLTLTDPTILSCFTGSVPQGRTLYDLTTFTCQDKDLSQANMAELGKLVNLQTLELRYSKIGDISALANLTKLKRLDLEFNELSSASILSRMTDLEYLNLRFNDISDISFLSGLNKLQELHLEANNIGDISTLAGKTTLRQLWLDDNQITNISYLSGLTNLTHLGLGYNRRLADNVSINDISYLANLTELQMLVLDANDITANATTGTGALANLAALQKLYLRGNEIEVTENNVLFPNTHHLWNLQTLELGFNRIENISVLSTLVNLTHLGLEDNQIKDASALQGLTSLQYLSLDHNFIRSTDSLNTLSGLTSYLDLRGNLLLDTAPLASMSNNFTLLTDDNCLGSIVMPSNIKAFGKYWQFPASKCDNPLIDDKPVAYTQQISLYKNINTAITLMGADPEGNTVTYAIISSSPSHGQIQSFSATTGNLTYIPATDYTGTDSITFSVTDPQGQTSQANVQIIILPPPLISDPALQSCFNGNLPDNSTLQVLEEFSCDGHNLSSADLSQVGRLPSLKRVALLHANLTDISGLTSIGASWTFLDLRFNSITNISSALANKTSVATLGLESNQISDISVIGNLTGLQAVYADGNDITGSGLPSLNNLTYLSLLTLRKSRLLTSDLESAWGNAVLETNLTVHLDQNCLISTPVLPSRINIQPIDGIGVITQQRTPEGTTCPYY